MQKANFVLLHAIENQRRNFKEMFRKGDAVIGLAEIKVGEKVYALSWSGGYHVGTVTRILKKYFEINDSTRINYYGKIVGASAFSGLRYEKLTKDAEEKIELHNMRGKIVKKAISAIEKIKAMRDAPYNKLLKIELKLDSLHETLNNNSGNADGTGMVVLLLVVSAVLYFGIGFLKETSFNEEVKLKKTEWACTKYSKKQQQFCENYARVN